MTTVQAEASPVASTRKAFAPYTLAASIPFALSALFFVFNCIILGFYNFTAGGIDFIPKADYTTYMNVVTSVLFIPSTIVAVVGLILWIVRLIQKKSLLSIALIVAGFQLFILILAIVLPGLAPAQQ